MKWFSFRLSTSPSRMYNHHVKSREYPMFRLLFRSHDQPIAIELDGKEYGERADNYQEKTVDLLQKIYATPTVRAAFTEDGVNFWQFMPSYLAIYLQLAVKLDDLLLEAKTSLDAKIFFAEAVRSGAYQKEFTNFRMGDLRFLLLSFFQYFSSFLTRWKKKRGDVCLMTIPRYFSHGEDVEFQPIENSIRKHGISYFYLDTPFYSDRSGHYTLWSILRHKWQRKSQAIFFDDSYCLRHFMHALQRRWKHRSIPAIKIEGVSPFLTDCINIFLAYASTILLPYDGIFLMEVAKDIVKKTRLKNAIITYEVGPYERALILNCLREGKKTIGITHGMKLAEPNYDYAHLDQNPTSSTGFTPPTVTCVYGKAQVDSLISSSSFKKSFLQIVGNWKVKTFPEDDTGLDAKLLYPITFFDAFNNPQLYCLIGEAVRIAGISLNDVYLRPHPGQNKASSIQAWKAAGFSSNSVLSNEDFPLYKVISKTRLCLHDFSSTILESAAFKKNVLFTTNNYPGRHIHLPNKNRFSTAEELAWMLQNAIEGHEDYKIDISYYYDTKGDPSERIVSLLELPTKI